MMQSKFPPGWNEERVRRVITHYEEQTEEEALAEDEAAYEDQTHTFMEIPGDLVPPSGGVTPPEGGTTNFSLIWEVQTTFQTK